jgi:hypothetical protein
MPYPWPIADLDVVLEQALDIVLDYLKLTGQVFPFSETQSQPGAQGPSIGSSWPTMTINAIEKRQAPLEANLQSLYPGVS